MSVELIKYYNRQMVKDAYHKIMSLLLDVNA